MQGIYQDFELTSFDTAWSVLHDLSENKDGLVSMDMIYCILEDNKCLYFDEWTASPILALWNYNKMNLWQKIYQD